jgi:hypothetical protein
MASLKLTGDTSGTVTLTVPAVAGTNTLTLPAVTDTLVGLAATQTLTNKIIQGGAITSATAQASTSGASIDFTSIPSWVKRITVMLSEVSSSGTSNYLIRLGDSGGFETTGYNVYSARFGSTSLAGSVFSDGFGIPSGAASNSLNGLIIFTNISGNTWVASGNFGDRVGINGYLTAGGKTLSDILTQVRIVTANGTDTFDAGTINIMYE